MPTLSIIIPIYNVERYLRRCLDALVEQSLLPYEVILVNDGTPDNSGAIAKEYAEKYPFMRYVEQENQGVSAARNKGLSLATGDFVTFCDSDDYYEVNFCEDISKAIEVYAAELYQFSYREIGLPSMMMSSSLVPTGKVCFHTREELLSGRIDYKGMMVWRYVYRMDIIREHQIAFPRGVTIAEDEIFCMRYFRYTHKMVYLDKAYYVYDRHEDSLTAISFGSFNSKSVASFRQNALTLIDDWGSDAPPLVRNRIEASLFSFTRSFLILPKLTKAHLSTLRNGIKEIMDKAAANGIKFEMERRYRLMYHQFPLYRWAYRGKRRLRQWLK